MPQADYPTSSIPDDTMLDNMIGAYILDGAVVIVIAQLSDVF